MSGPLAADRIKQTSTTTGTGTLSLDASVPSTYRSFATGVGNGNSCYFAIVHQTADEWEVRFGSLTTGTPDTLSRTTLISSSTGSAVSFSAGTKDVFVCAPAIYGAPILEMLTTRAIRAVAEAPGSFTVGDARGNYTVDFQRNRNTSNQVPSGNYSNIVGGGRNKVTGAYSSVLGGFTNTVSGDKGFIGGGQSNTASGTPNAVVVGGSGNVASAKATFIGGGVNNTANQAYCIVVGGYKNTAGGSGYCFIGGGYRNYTNSGARGTVGGGDRNKTSGTYATVAGGQRNYSHAQCAGILSGSRAIADKYSQYAHAAGNFSADGDAQTSEFVLRKQTTNATQAEMFLDNSTARMTMANDTTWSFTASIVARRTDANDESAHFFIQGAIDRNASAATTALVAAIVKTVIARDSAAWDVDINADTTNGALRIQVTGESGKTINWVATVWTVETTG